jgi:putative PEP-CTERM system histidine kinase
MNLLVTASYATAAAAFLVLALLLAMSGRERPRGIAVIVAAGATAIWAAVLAAGIDSVGFAPIYVSELLRDWTLVWLLTVLGHSAIPRGLRIGSHLLFAAIGVVAAVLAIAAHAGHPVVDAEMMLSRSGLIVALCGLLLLEQIYRNSAVPRHRAVRYLALGLGAVFAYDLFLYSQAELLRGIDAEAWGARGIVNALAVPLLAMAARRDPEWPNDIFVSRHVVFYSSTFLVVGCYLLLMAFGGYYVRRMGGSWGGIAQIIFLTSAIALLASLLLSSSWRRWLQVFISKHFYRSKYDYRAEWLRFIKTLSAQAENDVHRTALRAVTQIFSSPGGLLFKLDASGQRFALAAAWPVGAESVDGLSDLRADDDLIRFLVERQWIIDLDEYRRAPGAYQDIVLPDWLRHDSRLRIVAPMLELDRLSGFFVLLQPPPPFEMTFEDRDLLKTVGRHVATQIAQHDADRRLAESRQFAAYSRLTAFMMHDLKNSVAQLEMVVANAKRHKANPEFIKDAIDTIANTVARMTRLIEQLREGSVRGPAVIVSLESVARAAVEHCRDRRPLPRLEVADRSLRVRANPDQLASIIEHVIRNAQEATAEDGSVAVQLGRRERMAVIEIRDTGCGMDAQFVRERLFRPFISTKGETGTSGMGIGAFQTREYVQQLGGELEVQSIPGKGTVFCMLLPLMDDEVSDAPVRPLKAATPGSPT